jgi:hypothetical protein
VKTTNKSFESVEQFKYLEITLTDQNSIQEEGRADGSPGMLCCHSVQNLLYSSWLSKNIRIQVYKTIILSLVFFGCGTWSLILREELRLRVLENRVLRRIFGPKRD